MGSTPTLFRHCFAPVGPGASTDPLLPGWVREPDLAMRRFECVLCGFVYDEASGLPDDGIAPGTRWEDVPEDWTCPDCAATKADFTSLDG